MVAKDMADVIRIAGAGAWISQLGMAGMLVPLTKCFDLSRFVEGTLMPWKIEAKPELMDEVLVIPYGGITFTPYVYNKDIFEKHGLSVPNTWEEYITLLKKLKEKDECPTTILGKNIWFVAQQCYANRLCALKKDDGAYNRLFSDRGISFLDQDVIKVFKIWKEESEFFSVGWESYLRDQVRILFGQGKIATIPFIGGDPPEIVFYKKNFPQLNFGLYGPLFLDGAPIKFKNDPVRNLAVPIFSNHKEEAIKYIKYTVSDKVQLEKLLTLGSTPAIKGIVESEGAKQYLKDNPLAGWKLQRSECVLVPELVEWDDNAVNLMEEVANKLVEIGLGVKSVSQAAEELESMRKEMLEVKAGE